MDWQEFFKEHGDSCIQCLYFNGFDIKIEDLYQAIKARLAFETSSKNLYNNSAHLNSEEEPK